MSNAAPPFREQIFALFEPAKIFSLAVYHYFAVVFAMVFQKRQPSALLHPSTIRDEAFSNFWLDFTTPPANPPKELAGSAALVPPLFATARGRVLEIGPGSGATIQHFAPARSSISEIYGAEPAIGLHAKLHRQAESAGLGDKYHVLTCSAATNSIVPALAKVGLLQQGVADDGVFDTIICCRVLCSVPGAKETVENLYRLLRPGGKMVIVEHVVNPWTATNGSVLARIFQAVYMLMGWRFFVGDCELDRDTGGMLKDVGRQDGGWETIDLKTSFWWTALPYVSGQLVKRSDLKRN